MENWINLPLTICGGVLVIVFGQIVIRFILEPIIEIRKTVIEIIDLLGYYGNVYSNPGAPSKEIMDEARKELRRLSTSIRAKTENLPMYDFFSELKFVPEKEKVNIVAKSLMGISNSIYKGDPFVNIKWADDAREALYFHK
jgi:hypothetical protein